MALMQQNVTNYEAAFGEIKLDHAAPGRPVHLMQRSLPHSPRKAARPAVQSRFENKNSNSQLFCRGAAVSLFALFFAGFAAAACAASPPSLFLDEAATTFRLRAICFCRSLIPSVHAVQCASSSSDGVGWHWPGALPDTPLSSRAPPCWP